ncbi:MAG TPA: 6-bladed beta-propeller [Parapedobacter sp.]|uniref:6-bladed beta-propeller n=1 Tax=Parapedobacter sp. TaxID=1958893 RepID=UPI002C511201|nr:6-bladed beta-propeller [Parapedobacter sp.]HWK56405.1 6-bladed beta-propeller [Parapedobacter sp.]
MSVLPKFTALCLLCCACGNDKKFESHYAESDDSYVIDISKMHRMDNFREAIAEIEFIPLETNERSLIAEIDKVVFHKDRFYVLDKRYASLNVYSKAGKYIQSIGKMGRGPGEFSTLMDFMLDPEDESLLLLSNNEQAVFVYDLEGNHLQTIRNGLYANAIGKIGTDYYYFINHNDNELSQKNNLIVMNRLGKVLDRLFPFPEAFKKTLGYSGFIFNNSEGLLYSSPLSDTIFQLTNNSEIYPKYMFDFGKSTLPMAMRNSSDEYSKGASAYAVLHKQVVETENTLAFTYAYERSIITAFCHRKRSHASEESKILEPFRLGFPLSYEVVGTAGKDHFITSISVDFVTWIEQGHMSGEALERDYPSLYNLMPELAPTDNPILVVYKLQLQ